MECETDPVQKIVSSVLISLAGVALVWVIAKLINLVFSFITYIIIFAVAIVVTYLLHDLIFNDGKMCRRYPMVNLLSSQTLFQNSQQDP
jgi:hypothetical protein